MIGGRSVGIVRLRTKGHGVFLNSFYDVTDSSSQAVGSVVFDVTYWRDASKPEKAIPQNPRWDVHC
jgi:hypothetical protein